MANRNVWFMRNAELKIDTVVYPAVSGSTPLESQISATGTWTSRVKNVKLETGVRDISPINVMGIQQLKQEDRPQIVTLTFNTVFYPQGAATNTTLNDFLFGLGAAVGSTGYNRYQGGEKATNDRTDMAVLLKFERPTAAVATTCTFLLNNATITAGPVTSDAEGHTEQEWTAKCLAVDLYMDTGVTADPAT
jgi:hypothetical protein